MTDLHALLEQSVDHPVDLDTGADVRRGREALARRRRWTGAAVAAATVLALAGYVAAPGGHLRTVGPSDNPSGQTMSTHYFTFPEPPPGWSVQASDENLVVIAPDGLAKTDLHDPHVQLGVLGKLSIEYLAQRELTKNGTPIGYDGRAFYDLETDRSFHRVSVQDPSGNWLVVQEAPRLHWSLHQLIEFLDAVRVSTDAVPSDD